MPNGHTKAPLAVTFSGGGFRATLFHLGVLLYLLKNKLLTTDSTVIGVSGGAILAAHLGCHTDKYLSTSDVDFSEDHNVRAQITDLLSLVRLDLRNRVLRRWLSFYASLISIFLMWFVSFCPLTANVVDSWKIAYFVFSTLATLLFLLLSYLRAFGPNRTRLLQSEYELLFRVQHEHPRFLRKTRPAVLNDFRSAHCFVTATSLTTGQLVAFGNKQVRIYNVDGTVETAPNKQDYLVARSVCCSSAFPPAFAPVILTRDEMGNIKSGRDHRLTDGGVFDNLGVWLLGKAKVGDAAYFPDGGSVVVSDAGQPLTYADDSQTFGRIFVRNVRASDLLMYRMAEHDLNDAESGDELHGRPKGLRPAKCRIYENEERRHQLLDGGLQLQIAQLRTDLDRFSDDEIFCLVKHGAATARSEVANSPFKVKNNDDMVTDDDICRLCGLPKSAEEYQREFSEAHAPEKRTKWKSAVAGAWHLVGECARVVFARDIVCLTFLIPFSFCLLVGVHAYSLFCPRCPSTLSWKWFESSGGDAVLRALVSDVEARQGNESQDFRAHIRRSATLSEACWGGTPRSFWIRIPNTMVDGSVIMPSVYLASRGLSQSVETSAYSYRNITKKESVTLALRFWVNAPNRNDRLIVMLRIPKSGIPGHESENDVLWSDNFSEVLGTIEIECH